MNYVPETQVGLFRPEDFAAIRAHPAFQRTVDTFARAELSRFRSLPPRLRWLSRDLAGHALIGACLILPATPEGLTGARLVMAAQLNRTCSRGRALKFLDHLLAWAFAELEPGPESWSRRRVILSDDLRAAYGPERSPAFEAVATFDARLAQAHLAVRQPGAADRLLLALAAIQPTRPDLFAGPDMPIMLFLGRDGGKRILDDLLCRQRSDRERLLEPVRFSRSALARDNGVSRPHVSRLLSDGEAAGSLHEDGHLLTFAPALVEDVERHYALIFETVRVAAIAAGLAAA